MPLANPPPPAYVPHLTPLGNDVISHVLIGNMSFEGGRLKHAVESYQAAIQQNPSETIAHLYLAKCWFQLRDFDQAEVACLAALKLNPELVDALLLQGHLQAINGEWADAQNWYNQAIKADSQQPVAHAMLGFVHHRQNALEPAREAYLTAVRLDPAVSFWWLALADVSNQLGDPGTAQWAAQKALEINPLLAQAQYQLGVAYQKQGELEKARHMFDLASQGNSAHALGLMQQARLWARSEGSPRVLPIIEVLKAKYPRWVEVPLILGDAYLTDQNFKAALETFQEAGKLNPALAEPYYKMGLAYLGLGQRVEAREHFLAASERASAPSPAHVALEQLVQESPELAY
jgi:tetratricopeptide (TPR) repeat protein